jgi:hypothetical protein
LFSVNLAFAVTSKRAAKLAKAISRGFFIGAPFSAIIPVRLIASGSATWAEINAAHISPTFNLSVDTLFDFAHGQQFLNPASDYAVKRRFNGANGNA